LFFYHWHDQLLISWEQYQGFVVVPEKEVQRTERRTFFLYRQDPAVSRRSFAITDSSLLFNQDEGINLLQKNDNAPEVPDWLKKRIEAGKVTAVNTLYPLWQDVLNNGPPEQWRVNIVGLGDVGGMLLTGLRLLGGKHIERIGIFDIDQKKVLRWEYEANQIRDALPGALFPEIRSIEGKNLFDCDLFVFCVSVGVPPVGQKQKDVRMAQFGGNSRIISQYAKQARNSGFQGIFAVVSDPVDLLCRVVFAASNQNEAGFMDYQGLAPEQIRGYGLGVMFARAAYFAAQNPDTSHFIREGRVFGPHGQGLVVADSIDEYHDECSQELTEKTVAANLIVRETGYKPFIAPALSSGALALLATITGRWHYSATFMGGVFMGAKNRLTPAGVELERLDLPQSLSDRLKDTYRRLREV